MFRYLLKAHTDQVDLHTKDFKLIDNTKGGKRMHEVFSEPESIMALALSAAVLESGWIWILEHISSNSCLLFITNSFILLAFSLVSLSTSADAYWKKNGIRQNCKC